MRTLYSDMEIFLRYIIKFKKQVAEQGIWNTTIWRGGGKKERDKFMLIDISRKTEGKKQDDNNGWLWIGELGSKDGE